MAHLLINRVPLTLDPATTVRVVMKKRVTPSLCEGRVSWVRDWFLQQERPERELFSRWVESQNAAIEDSDFLSIAFYSEDADYSESLAEFSYIGRMSDSPIVSRNYLKFELGKYLIERSFIVDPCPFARHMSAYQCRSSLDDSYDVYWQVDFKWDFKRQILAYNIGRENVLVSKHRGQILRGYVLDNERGLVYRSSGSDVGLSRCSAAERRRLGITPHRFKYGERYQALSDFANEYLHNFGQSHFRFRNRGFMSVSEQRIGTVAEHGRQPLVFGRKQVDVDAVTGMREHGPYEKPRDSTAKKLLFIYGDKDSANTLFRYLKQGRRHFPGLLSYASMQVTLANPAKGVVYKDVESLHDQLRSVLEEHYPSRNAADVIAVVIGPFKKFQSTEGESRAYYDVKRLLLEYGIASQFVHTDTVAAENVHYMLPNIAIGLLAKAGGIPWKLKAQRRKELVVGLNTKLMEKDRFLGSAVFFDNEGRLGCVRSLPVDNETALVAHLRDAIEGYTRTLEDQPERLTIHYYKPPRRDEIKQIAELLHDQKLSIPWAIVEVNDSPEKMDICFDSDYGMGMPQSGTYVRIESNQYLLFKNERHTERPNRYFTDQLPLKLRIQYNGGGGFTDKQLIEQVYEFCHLNWSGLHTNRSPITTKYSKIVAEFSSKFGGVLPENETTKSCPWFL